MMKSWCRKQNFTLIELMVVVMVILILAAILMSGVTAVQERAKRTDCLTRVSQLAKNGTMYSANNNGQVCLSGYYLDGESNAVHLSDWTERLMGSIKPSAVNKRDGAWWMFICTNVLPYWNHGATMNATGYTKGQKNPILEPVWERIQPGNQGKTDYIGQVVGETQDAVYAFGNFGVNKNGDIVSRIVKDGSGISRGVQILHVSQIKSPAARAFIVEEGESTDQDNGTHDVQYVEYSEPISRGRSGDPGSGTGYIPGLGGGGVGKEKMETIGVDATISEDELDSFRLDRVLEDIWEGRHFGETLHGFFDGHAESITVDVVGSLQLGPGDDKNDLTGPYGKITKAATDDD